MDIKKFSVYTFLGSLPWCLALTYIGFWLGDVMGDNPGLIFSKFHGLDIVIIVCVVAFVAWYLWHIKKGTSIEK
jgi:membrane protein DedA with SNARE-associated domain